MVQEKLYQLAYDPKQDITLWELAQIIGLNMELTRLNKPIPAKALEALDITLLRHYQAIDVTEEFKTITNPDDPGSESINP